MLTPSTTTPCGAIVLLNASSDGASSTHGPHQLAQKLSTSSLPPKFDAVTVLPSSVTTLNSGAGSPAFTTFCSSVGYTTHARAPPRARIAAIRILSGVRNLSILDSLLSF